MPTATSNGLTIAYEDHGNSESPAMLLVQGLGLPSAAWPPEFIEYLAARGLRVFTFDNRDSGQSEHISAPQRSLPWQFLRLKLGLTVNAPYQLGDMMQDAVGLLDALNIDSAHIVGISMGGMISQLMAIHAPERVRSLVCIMSTSGNPELPGASPPVVKHMLRRPAENETGRRYDYYRELWRLIGSPDYPTSESRRQEFLQRVFERGISAAGSQRQLLAIMSARSRVDELAALAVPTLVIHGEADPLVPVECGVDTAEAIPGATLETIPGMGHDLPAQLMPKISELTANHAMAVES